MGQSERDPQKGAEQQGPEARAEQKRPDEGEGWARVWCWATRNQPHDWGGVVFWVQSCSLEPQHPVDLSPIWKPPVLPNSSTLWSLQLCPE